MLYIAWACCLLKMYMIVRGEASIYIYKYSVEAAAAAGGGGGVVKIGHHSKLLNRFEFWPSFSW